MPAKTKASQSIFTPEFWIGFWQRLTDNALHSLLQIGGIVLAYLVLRAFLYRLIDGILARLLAHETRIGVTEERAGRLQTLQGLCKSVVSYVLFFVFGILFLKAIGFDIMPFITTAGVIGLAIGFGAQKLVKDVISGFFIIIDNLFVVGDTVTIGAVTGQVQEMGMRVTRLLDANGRVYLLSNGDIGTVVNLSRHPVEDMIEINVAASADLNRVIRTIDAKGKALFKPGDHHLKAAPHVLGITAFTAASVTVRVSVVADPRDLLAEQMRVRAAVREALLAAEIPLA
jgi:small-conductance mechanosensitive channel